jgi:hypothetical protein
MGNPIVAREHAHIHGYFPMLYFPVTVLGLYTFAIPAVKGGDRIALTVSI